MKTALIELHYLPSIAYFTALSTYERVIVEKYEHYRKQSFRNRCYVLGPHRVETLTVPVTGKGGKATVSEVRIDYGQKWVNNHWRTLQSGYGKAPFFEYYAPELREVLFKNPVFLYDLNLKLMTLCLKWLRLDVAVAESGRYEKEPPAGITDLRGALTPKREEGLARLYRAVEYRQVFGSKFVPNLSVIDLVFNQGPGALSIVKASSPNEQ